MAFALAFMAKVVDSFTRIALWEYVILLPHGFVSGVKPAFFVDIKDNWFLALYIEAYGLNVIAVKPGNASGS